MHFRCLTEDEWSDTSALERDEIRCGCASSLTYEFLLVA